MFREKFNVVPNTVEVDFFEKGSEKFNHFTFLQVANLDENKNQKMLIKAFSRFDQSSDVRLKNWRRRKINRKLFKESY